MELNHICKPIKDDLDRVHSLLRSRLATEDEFISKIVEYILVAPGKRLRPVLALFASKIGGYGGERIIQLATVIELMHTASLIHDDILDRAVLRRKRTTVNLKWDNELSVLFGDFLFSQALSLLVSMNSPQALGTLVKVINEMCVGEMMQVDRRNDFNLSEEEYLSIIEKKTAVLFSASSGLGASLGGASVRHTNTMYRYGLNFGVAFQIIDDCLDLIGSEVNLGKSLRSDVREGKITLPLIFLMRSLSFREKARLEVLLRSCEESFAIDEIREMAQRHGAIDYSLQRAEQFMSKAKEELDRIDGFRLKGNLRELADYVPIRIPRPTLTELSATE